MKFKGFKLNSLSDMKPGNIYVFVEEVFGEKKAWAFIYEGFTKSQLYNGINQECRLIINDNKMVFGAQDQDLIDKGQCELYTLEEM